ncbi:MAG TPA: M12 family metallo-peptidase [Pyrinomonadaceae bacterium]|nr:M12 family metallo-peptidase [Pyrinomonadaceae bacterium]
MKEINRSRLTRAVKSMVCSHLKLSSPLVILLCLICAVVAFSLFFDNDLRVSAAGRNPVRKLNLPHLVFSGHAPARPNPLENQPWRDEKKRAIKRSRAEMGVAPALYRSLSLDEIAQRNVLSHAPMEFTTGALQTEVVISLPMPDGKFARFRVEESPVMAPELAARFPAIKTYRGKGLDDPTATTRFDMTPAGFHAIVLSTRGTVIIEPAAHGQAGKYVSYEQRDAQKDAGSSSCLVFGAEKFKQSEQLSGGGKPNLANATGSTLRTYRLAIAATAEYTQTYGGGTVAGALSALTTTINGVNAIYERDLAIHLTLVANETSIIFTNSATDGYTSDSATSLITQNQVVLDQKIGSANYDVGMVLDGHVYAFQPGRFIFQGAGQPQSGCVTGKKGMGVSIFRSTEPSTITAIYVVAHELGHMFGALHTFNGTLEDCGPSRFAQAAYEPGSGSTIMANWGGLLPNGIYYPLCGTEALSSNDTYFHAYSIEQIVNFTTFGAGSACPVLTPTGNNPPQVNAGADYTIPANTPFALTATASDTEADALTYSWEEFDLGAAGPPHTDNGDRPIFRSFPPVPSPTRTFPQLSDILSGTSTFGESLPVTTRSMNFRVTVRDNHAGGGGVNTGAMWVNVRADSGPFTVTQPGSATTWTAGSSQTVTWNVANTSSAPVSCANVRVLLSIDGGASFPYTLASSTPNTGAVTISVPNTPTSTARIKVEAVGNIFFNISLPNFTIAPNSTAAPTLLTEENTNRAVALESVLFMPGPFSLPNTLNFSFDQRTRIVLFAVGLELMAGEDASAVTARAEDSGHQTYPLTVESVGKVPGFNWLTQVNVRLPDGLPNTGDLTVSIIWHGAVSNKAVIAIR